MKACTTSWPSTESIACRKPLVRDRIHDAVGRVRGRERAAVDRRSAGRPFIGSPMAKRLSTVEPSPSRVSDVPAAQPVDQVVASRRFGRAEAEQGVGRPPRWW